MYTNFVENRFPNKNLVDFWHRFWFINKRTEPTRVTDRTKSLLDVILVSHAERYITSGNLQLGLSDHDLVFVFKKNKLPHPKPRLIEYRSLENIWGHWSALYKNILDRHAPIRSTQHLNPVSRATSKWPIKICGT